MSMCDWSFKRSDLKQLPIIAINNTDNTDKNSWKGSLKESLWRKFQDQDQDPRVTILTRSLKYKL